MKALIDTQTQVQHIVSWVGINPVLETYPNSARIAEVAQTDFEVASPLFWVDCADNVLADQFWYNTSTQEINPIINEPISSLEQPTTSLPTV